MLSTHPTSPVFTRGRVTANQDPEKEGRIQISYPLYSNSSEETSEWARIISPFASKDAGFWFVPEVGDEVIVLFEASDPSRPVVLGSVYSPKNAPPTSGESGDGNSDGNNELRFIKTKSGNLLLLSDKSGKTTVTLKESSGAQLKLEAGKVALGTSSVELLDVLINLLDTLSQSAPTFVATAMGPGLLNPGAVAKIVETKMKLQSIKGSL